MTSADHTSTLLELVLAEAPGQRGERLEDLCRDHPALEGSLRRRFRALDDLGLLDEVGLDEVEPDHAGLAAADAMTGEQSTPLGLSSGTRFGPFVIEELLGVGGMGRVYAAADSRTGHQVALKLLRPELTVEDSWEARFQREIAVAARLDHPHIARLLDSGNIDGQAFFAVERIDGPGLDAVIDGMRGRPVAERKRTDLASLVGQNALIESTRSTEQEIAGLMAQAARALQHAHSSGVVHRDIKPSNLMVDRERGLQLLDFGLARDDQQSVVTKPGTLLGSVAYMAPEQTRGEVCDARSDVFSLGAVIYELLTLRAPFGRGSSVAVIEAVRSRDPAPLRNGVPGLGRSFHAVIERALEKDPERRYQTAEEFAEDLEALASGRSVVARLPGPVRRTGRFIRRNPWRAAALVGVTVSLLALAGFGGFLWAKSQVLSAGEEALRSERVERLWGEVGFALLQGTVEESSTALDALGTEGEDQESLARFRDFDPDSVLQQEAQDLDTRMLQSIAIMWGSRRDDPGAVRDARRLILEVILGRGRRRLIDLSVFAVTVAAGEDAAEARAVADVLSTHFADSPFANYWAGRAVLRWEPERTRKLFDRAIDLDSGRALFHAELGMACIILGDSGSAEESLREALRLDPNNDRAALSLGGLYRQSGHPLEAERVFRSVIDRSPGFPAAHYALGELLLATNPDQARASFRTALKLEPMHREARYQLAALAAASGDVETAIAEFDRLRKDHLDWAEPHAALASLFIQTEEKQRAVEVYESLSRIRPLNEVESAWFSALRQELEGGSRGR